MPCTTEKFQCCHCASSYCSHHDCFFSPTENRLYSKRKPSVTVVLPILLTFFFFLHSWNLSILIFFGINLSLIWDQSVSVCRPLLVSKSHWDADTAKLVCLWWCSHVGAQGYSLKIISAWVSSPDRCWVNKKNYWPVRLWGCQGACLADRCWVSMKEHWPVRL